MNKKVTVLIPFYNSATYLVQAVESVFKQTYANWELILIDDASTDQSLKSIEAYLQDSRVTLIQNPQNVGQAKSLNNALRQVKTPYVIQLDSDDWFLPHTLEVLVQEAERHSEKVALFGGNSYIVYENSKGEKALSVFLKGRSYTNKYDFMLANQTMLPRFYRTSALQQVGGWSTNDPFEGRVLEDRSIQLKLIANYDFYSVNHTLYNYRRHKNNQTEDIPKYVKAVDWIVRDALKSWGDEYEPVFMTFAKGWKKVVRLDPKKPGIEPIKAQDIVDEHNEQNVEERPESTATEQENS